MLNQEPKNIRKIGLLGGSFNPIHKAHLCLALTAADYLNLDQVQLIPAGQPWQKRPLQTSTEDRLAMLRLAITEYPVLAINLIEIERDGFTYTIDTLKSLAPGPRYYWLMGSDQLNNFCSWHNWQEILHFVQLAVVQRPGHAIKIPTALQDELQQHQHTLVFIPFNAVDISSTQIRQKLQQGDNISVLVPPPVLDYIKQKGLYTEQNF